MFHDLIVIFERYPSIKRFVEIGRSMPPESLLLTEPTVAWVQILAHRPRMSPVVMGLEESKMRSLWTAYKFWLSLACSTLLLMLVLRQADWDRTVATLQTVDGPLLGLGVGSIIAAYVVFALRWRVLLSNTICLSVRDIFSYIMIGYLANTVLPLRLGEVARAALLGKRHGISPSLVFGSVVLERTLDVFMVLLVALGVSWLRDLPPIVRAGMVTFAGAGLLAVVSLCFLARFGKYVPEWVARLRGVTLCLPVQRVADWVAHFAAGLSTLRDGRQLGVALLFSAVIWLLVGTGTIAYIAAFHLSTPWYAGFFVLAVINLGTAIPSSPSAIGVYHYSAVLALSVWGANKSDALGFALGTHGITVILNFLLGGGCLVREGLSLHALSAMSRDSTPSLVTTQKSD